MTKKTAIFAAALFGLALGARAAHADEWTDAREDLRRAQEELAKDTRQMNEAWAKRDRKGVENERAEIVKDQQAVARARTKLDDLRRAGRWGGYDSYDDDWGRRDDDSWGGDWWDRDVPDDQRAAWHDAREDLLRAEAELRKDQRQLRDALNRRDYRGAENERREIDRDYRDVARARQRLADLAGGGDHGRPRGWHKHKKHGHDD